MTTQSVLASGLRPRTIGTTPPSTQWGAPEVWLDLPDISGEDKFVGLAAINEHSTYFAFIVVTEPAPAQASQGFQVDWGNGDVLSYTSGTRVSYLYDFSSVDDYTGVYNQALITITPLGDDTLKEIDLNIEIGTELAGGDIYYGTSPWLELSVESPTLTVFNVGAGHPVTDIEDNPTGGPMPPNIHHRILKKAKVRCPSVTDYSMMFHTCEGLESLDIDTSAGENFFCFLLGCTAMSKFPELDLANATNLDYAFSHCSILGTLPIFNLPNCTTITGMFYYCTLIKNIEITAPSVTTCENLATWAKVLHYIDLQTPSCTVFDRAFWGCDSLGEVYDIEVSSGVSFIEMFKACTRLTYFPDKDFPEGSDFSGMFFNCTYFGEVPHFTFPKGDNFGAMLSETALVRTPHWDFPVGTIFTSMFAACPYLQIADLWLPGVTRMEDFDSMVSNCGALHTLAIYSAIGPIGNIFNCHSLTVLGGEPFTFTATNFTTISYRGNYGLTEIVGIDLSEAIVTNSIRFHCDSNPRLSRIQVKGLAGTTKLEWCNFSAEGLNEVFTSLETVVSATISVFGNPGTDTCDTSIATAKGWTVDTTP